MRNIQSTQNTWTKKDLYCKRTKIKILRKLEKEREKQNEKEKVKV